MSFDLKKNIRSFICHKLWYEYLIFIAIVFREKIHSTGKNWSNFRKASFLWENQIFDAFAFGIKTEKHRFFRPSRLSMLFLLLSKPKKHRFTGLLQLLMLSAPKRSNNNEVWHYVIRIIKSRNDKCEILIYQRKNFYWVTMIR